MVPAAAVALALTSTLLPAENTLRLVGEVMTTEGGIASWNWKDPVAGGPNWPPPAKGRLPEAWIAYSVPATALKEKLFKTLNPFTLIATRVKAATSVPV